MALAICIAVLLHLLPPSHLGPAAVQAQANALDHPFPPGEESRSTEPIDGASVLLDGQSIVVIRRGILGFSAQERAEAITRRIKQFAQDDSRPIDSLSLQPDADDDFWYVSTGQHVLLTITAADAHAHRMTPRALGEESLRNIQAALRRYRQDRQPGQLLRNSLYALMATAAILSFCLVLLRVSVRLLPRLGRILSERGPALRFNSVEIVSASTIAKFWLQVLNLLRLAVILVAFFYYAAFVLRLFPWTRSVGEGIRGHFYGAVELVLSGIGNYLPNLFIVAIIIFLAYSILRAVRPFVGAIDRGALVIPGFYADWAQPTYNLLVLLVVALALVLAFPYLPGFSSPAFQGVSVFLGLLLSLGSTSAITNVVGGIILIYTRAFRIGDHMRVGEVIGDIIEKNFLAVRICTPANQIITIPNSVLLTNKVVNYSLSERDLSRSLILQTTITLGYDVPWRKVHATLIEAALASDHILRQPAPFVLQTDLGNHCIRYQLNAYTDKPSLMVLIYSELHQGIQDQCRQAGIEILSPTYAALRDGNASTIPETDGSPRDGAAAS